jgi:hypothetical protein
MGVRSWELEKRRLPRTGRAEEGTFCRQAKPSFVRFSVILTKGRTSCREATFRKGLVPGFHPHPQPIDFNEGFLDTARNDGTKLASWQEVASG